MKLSWCHNRLAIGYFVPKEVVTEEKTEVEEGLQCLQEGKITHAINCRTDEGTNAVLQVYSGLAVLWNPTDDDGEPKSVNWFARSIDFATGALASSPRHKVCVYCYHGNNRSPSVALAILMAQGLSYEDALAKVLKARPGAAVRYRENAREALRMLGYVKF